jgi:ribosomal protein S4
MNGPETPSQRLDLALVARGLVATRAKARDLIARGEVTVDGLVASKVAMGVREGQAIAVNRHAAAQVSRGAVKLAAALEHFGLDASGRTAAHRRADSRRRCWSAERIGSTRWMWEKGSFTRRWRAIPEW